MLRASIEYHGTDGDLRAVTQGSKIGDSGIAHGETLVTFAEAAVTGDSAQLATARDAVRAAIGSDGLVDAAAVIGNFQRMVRIADGTGNRVGRRGARTIGGLQRRTWTRGLRDPSR
jgi:hypothetical protein